MNTRSNRGRGKLYEVYSEEFVANISYQVHEEFTRGGSLEKWWGELILVEHVKIRDSASYIVELEDRRKGKCSLKRRINKAVIGVPPRYFYLFQGGGSLE